MTALTARWGDLSPSERRRLLAEVRGRMAQNQARRDRAGPPRVAGGVVLQRRYGRKADGSVVVETRVLELAPQMAPRAAQAPEAAAAQRDPGGARVTFGIGFEQRVRRTRQPPADRVLETDLTASHPQTEGQLDRSQSAP